MLGLLVHLTLAESVYENLYFKTLKLEPTTTFNNEYSVEYYRNGEMIYITRKINGSVDNPAIYDSSFGITDVSEGSNINIRIHKGGICSDFLAQQVKPDKFNEKLPMIFDNYGTLTFMMSDQANFEEEPSGIIGYIVIGAVGFVVIVVTIIIIRRHRKKKVEREEITMKQMQI